jgi:hypothetical protein
MRTPNPYSPPASKVEASPGSSGARPVLPWLLVLRWMVGLAVLVHGLFGLYALSRSWDFMADQAIIDSSIAPYRYLPAVVFKVATGVAILLRTKWSLLLVLAWTAAYAYPFASSIRWSNLPSAFFLSLMEQIAILGFLCLLWFRGRLR